MDSDAIYVNIDREFNYSLAVFNDLIQENQLKKTHDQQAWLNPIKSANSEGDSFFGGKKATLNQRSYQFGRTASSVFRMVMFRAVQIPNEINGTRIWPEAANENRIQFQVLPPFAGQDPFQLIRDAKGADLKSRAERIWAEYDRVFPPSFIKSKMLREAGTWVNFENEMLIFRYDNNTLIQVIKIGTKAAAFMEQNNGFPITSKVKVKLRRKMIHLQLQVM